MPDVGKIMQAAEHEYFSTSSEGAAMTALLIILASFAAGWIASTLAHGGAARLGRAWRDFSASLAP